MEDVTSHLMPHLSLHPTLRTYLCVLTNDYTSTNREIVEFYNLRGGKERIFDEMNNGFGWARLPKSFMAENSVFLLLTAIIRNFYKFLMGRLDTKAFGLKKTILNCGLGGGQTCYGYTEGRTAGGVTWGHGVTGHEVIPRQTYAPCTLHGRALRTS